MSTQTITGSPTRAAPSQICCWPTVKLPDEGTIRSTSTGSAGSAEATFVSGSAGARGVGTGLSVNGGRPAGTRTAGSTASTTDSAGLGRWTYAIVRILNLRLWMALAVP